MQKKNAKMLKMQSAQKMQENGKRCKKMHLDANASFAHPYSLHQ